MLCAVYKSSRKDQTYLYVPGKDDFSRVPAPLMASFGKPVFVMLMPLHKQRQLPQVEFDKLVADLNEKGFYLQLPPPVENLLDAHLAEQTRISKGDTE